VVDGDDPPPEIDGRGVTLVPVGAEQVDDVLAGRLGSRAAAPGWPHDDSAPGLGFARSGGWTWLIVDGDGRVAGECGVKARPGSGGVVEIGYGLAPGSRGRGLGTDAVGLLVDWLSARPDVARIEAEVAADNLASRRLLERLGFGLDDARGHYLRYGRADPADKTGLSPGAALR
jgi:ribosomal protein S18 acetylase RimI-like enzyme